MNTIKLKQKGKPQKQPTSLWIPFEIMEWLNTKTKELNCTRAGLIIHIIKEEAKREIKITA